jgi:flavorubredoxin
MGKIRPSGKARDIHWSKTAKKEESLLVISGGLHDNTHRVLESGSIKDTSFSSKETVVLKDLSDKDMDDVVKSIPDHDAVLVGTGAYWDSCSSHLQKFIEKMTVLEGSRDIIGKPAGFVVTCDSVGGKSVLNRLQAVFSSFGFMVPPMSGIVLSNAISKAAKDGSEIRDVWMAGDIDTVIKNLSHCPKSQEWTKWDIVHLRSGEESPME